MSVWVPTTEDEISAEVLTHGKLAFAIPMLSVMAKTEQSAQAAFQTPEWLVQRIHALMGGIELDPCTIPENPCRAQRFYAPPEDGILLPWDADSIYVNPPYGRTIKHWTEKAAGAAASGSRVAVLAPARTCSRWFQELWAKADALLFIRSRMRFREGDFTVKFPNVIFGLNLDLEPLADLGEIVRLQCRSCGNRP